MPSRLSFFLLASVVTLPISAAGDPVPVVDSSSGVKAISESGVPVSDENSSTEAKPVSVAADRVHGRTSASKTNLRIEKPTDISKFGGIFKPHTFGWIEQVILSPELRWKIDAKLDTGADTSSLDAHDIRRVRYKGQSYVRFSIKNPQTRKMISLRRPYVRSVRIRNHSGNHQRRRVVLMTVCLGNSVRTIEVTLTDREYFDYPMLLGRSALSGVALVNPMAKHTTEPNCKTEFKQVAEGEIEMAGDIDKPDFDVAGKSAQDSELPSEINSIDTPEIPEPLKNTTDNEKPADIPLEVTGDEEPSNLGAHNVFYAPFGRSLVLLSHTIKRSGSHHVRS